MAVSAAPAVVCLVLIGDRRKKIYLRSPCTILDVKHYVTGNAHLRSLVGSADNVIYQLFDREFEEYVDVETDNEPIYDKSKIKILFEDPPLLDEDAVTCIVKEEPRQSLEECLGSQDENTVHSIEDSEDQYNMVTTSPGSSVESRKANNYLLGRNNSMVVSSTTNLLDSPSVLGYTLPDFPFEVIRALEARIIVDTRLKRKIIDTLFHDMTNRTLYPGKLYAVAAATLVSCYPHLRDSAGSGYDSWFHGLKWKFKNERRKMHGSDVVDAMRQRYRPRLIVQEQNIMPTTESKNTSPCSVEYSMIGRLCESLLPNIHATQHNNADSTHATNVHSSSSRQHVGSSATNQG